MANWRRMDPSAASAHLRSTLPRSCNGTLNSAPTARHQGARVPLVTAAERRCKRPNSALYLLNLPPTHNHNYKIIKNLSPVPSSKELDRIRAKKCKDEQPGHVAGANPFPLQRSPWWRTRPTPEPTPTKRRPAP